MGKKRFIACLLIVLLLAVCAVTLVACKEKSADILLPDVPPADATAPGPGDLLLVMLEAMGAEDEFTNMNFESIIKTNFEVNNARVTMYYKFYLKGNFKLESENDPGGLELGLGLIACKDEHGTESEDKSNNFEIFFKEGGFYLSIGETAFYLEDVDFRWLYEQIDQIGIFTDPDILVGTIINATGLEMEDTGVADLIQLVSMLIFQIDNKLTTYDMDTGSGHIALKFNPDQLINTIIAALGGTSIDSVLGGFGMKLMLPTGETLENGEPEMKAVSIDNFLKTLKFPNIDVYVEADFDGYYMDMDKGLKLGVYSNIYDDDRIEYFEMITSASFEAGKYEDFIGDKIKNYKPFGLLKLRFDTEIQLSVNKLDIGKIVNLFAGYEFLPANGDLEITVSTDFVIKLDLDLRLKEVNGQDLSLLLFELYDGDDYRKNKEAGTLETLQPLFGLYLRDRQIFVNLDNIPGGEHLSINVGNVRVGGANVTQWLSKAVDMLTGELEKIIDQYFPEKKGQKDSQTFGLVNSYNGVELPDKSQVVFAIGHNSEGESYISPALGTILDILRYSTGFEDSITHKDNVIQVLINQVFVKTLHENFGLNIPALGNGDVDFGYISLDINVNKTGIEDIRINIRLKDLFDVQGQIVMDNVRYGWGHREYLEKSIIYATSEKNATGDLVDKDGAIIPNFRNLELDALLEQVVSKKYISNVKDLIYNAINDLDLEFAASLHFDEGDYNISKIFGTDTGLPDVTIHVENKFDLNLTLKIQTQMENVTDYDNIIGYEKDTDGNEDRNKPIYGKKTIIARAKISIINEKANPIFPKDNMSVNVYYLDDRFADVDNTIPESAKAQRSNSHGVLYFDMSQFDMIKIGIPSFALGVDLSEMILSEIDKLDKFDIAIPELFPESSTASTFSARSNSSRNGKVASESDILYAMFTNDNAEIVSRQLQIKVTTAMVNKILALAGVQLGFTLPDDIDITLDITNGITLNVGGVDDGKEIALSLSVVKFKFGVPNKIDMTEFNNDMQNNPEKYGAFISVDDLTGGNPNVFSQALIQSFAKRALDDVDISFNIKFSLGAGTYDISKILGFEISGLPSLPVTIASDAGECLFDFDINIKLQSAMVDKLDAFGNKVPIKKPTTYDVDGNVISGDVKYEQEQVISRALITIQNKQKNPITPNGNGVIRIMYFDDRYKPNEGINGLKKYAIQMKEENGVDVPVLDENNNPIVTKTHGTALLQLSTFNILKFNLPNFALDIDLTETINDILKDINFSSISYNSGDNNNAKNSGSMLATIADSSTDNNTVSAIEIKFTTELLNSLLGGMLQFELPEMDGDIRIDANTGLTLNIVAIDTSNGVAKKIGATISLLKLGLGANIQDKDFDDMLGFEMSSMDLTSFGDPAPLSQKLINTIIYRALDDVDLSFNFKIHLTKGTYDIGEVLEMFKLNFGSIPFTIEEDFDLDLDIKIQLMWDEFQKLDNGKYVPDGSGIARAKVIIVNKTNNVLFPLADGETERTILSVYYLDDRAKINQGMLNTEFIFDGVNKMSHGTLFADLSAFSMLGLKLPNISADVDLTKELLGTIGGLNLSEQTYASTISGSSQSRFAQNIYANALSTIADGDNTDADKEVTEVNYLRISITLQLIADILEQAGVYITIPSELTDAVDGSLTIGQESGINLQVSFTQNGQKLQVGLGVNKVSIGSELIEYKEGTSTPLAKDEMLMPFGNKKDGIKHLMTKFGKQPLKLEIGSILPTLLDDTKISLRFKVNVPAGKYNLASLLTIAGVDMDEFFVNFDEDFTLDLGLTIQLQLETCIVLDVDKDGLQIAGTEHEELIIARAYIELMSYSKNFIFDGSPTGTPIIKMYYFDDRFPGNSSLNLPQYSEKEVWDVDSAGDEIPGTRRKIVDKTHGTICADLTGLRIASIKLPKIMLDMDLTQTINNLTKKDEGTDDNTQTSSMSNGYSLANGLGLVADGDTKAIDGLQNFIAITIASKTIQEILNMTVVGDMIDISFIDFDITLATSATEGINLSATIHYTDDNDQSYQRDVDLFLALNALELGVPTEIDLSDFNYSNFAHNDVAGAVKDVLKYGHIEAKLNVDVSSTEIDVQELLSLFISADQLGFNLPIKLNLKEFANEIDLILQWEFDFDNARNSKLFLQLNCDGSNLFGVYVKDGTIYVDMKGFGLFKFKITNSNFVQMILDKIDEALGGLNGLIPLQANVMALQETIAKANNMSVNELNYQLLTGDVPSTTDDGSVDIMDYVVKLLGNLTIDNGVISAELTADIISDLLKLANINIALDIDAKLSLDIFGGNLMLDAEIDNNYKFALGLNIVKIGEQDTNFVVNENAGNTSGIFHEINGVDTSHLIDSIFDKILEDTTTGADGLWADIIAKNTAVTESSFARTQITMEKLTSDRSLDCGGVSAGDMLISISRMDEFTSKYSVVGPAIYAVIKADGYLFVGLTDYLINRIAGISIAGAVGWINLNLNIKQTIKDLVGDVFVSTADEGGNNVQTTGEKELNELFSNLDAMSLLNGITLTMYDVKNIRINVELNSGNFNNLVKDLFGALRGLKLSLAGANVTVGNLNYTPEDGLAFNDRIWNNLIRPIVEGAAGGLGIPGFLVNAALNSDIQYNIKDLLSRLLPLPAFGEGELNANVWLLDGKLDNIQLIGYEAGNKTDIQRQRFELRIFNDMSKTAFFGDMNYLDLNNAQLQLPYVSYDATLETEADFLNQFMNKAYRPDKGHMYYYADRQQYATKPDYLLNSDAYASWYITEYSPTGFGADGTQIFTDNGIFFKNKDRNDMAGFKNSDGSWKTGYYIATGRASISGTPVTTTVKIFLEDSKTLLNHNDTVVRDVVVHAGETLPDTVVLENKTLNKVVYVRNNRADGTPKFEFIGATPSGFDEANLRAEVRFIYPNNAGAKRLVVNVHWDNRRLKLVDGETAEIDIYNAKEFYDNFYSKDKLMVETFDGRKLEYEVESITAKDALFSVTNGVVTYSNINNWYNGFKTEVQIRLKGYEETIIREVDVRARRATAVYINGRNTISLNTLQSKYDLPKSAMVFFENGDSGTYEIVEDSWEGINGNLGVAGSYNVKFKIKLAFETQTGLNTIGNNPYTIKLNIKDSNINYVALTKDVLDSGDKYHTISYMDYASGQFEKYIENFDIWLKTTNNTVVDYNDTIKYITRWEREGFVTIYNYEDYNKLNPDIKALYTPIYETIKNYDINVDGSVGINGGKIKISITLYFYQANTNNTNPTVNGSNNARTAYIYFNVLAKGQ